MSPGKTLAWQRYFLSGNCTGLSAPGSVDCAAIRHAGSFEAGHSDRWIDSSRERPVRIALGTQAFAGRLYLTISLNGQRQCQGQLTGRGDRLTDVAGRARRPRAGLRTNLQTACWITACQPVA